MVTRHNLNISMNSLFFHFLEEKYDQARKLKQAIQELIKVDRTENNLSIVCSI